VKVSVALRGLGTFARLPGVCSQSLAAPRLTSVAAAGTNKNRTLSSVSWPKGQRRIPSRLSGVSAYLPFASQIALRWAGVIACQIGKYVFSSSKPLFLATLFAATVSKNILSSSGVSSDGLPPFSLKVL
jgi:hypothetical protein